MNENTVRKQVIVPTEMNDELERIAAEKGTTVSECMRKALTLIVCAYEKKEEGLKLGFDRDPSKFVTEVINL